MKKHILSAAITAATLTGFSGGAMAWNPTQTPDLEVFMSGATAMDNAITSLFQNLCQAGTLDTYFNSGANPGNAYRAFFCTLSSDEIPGLSSAQKVLFIKRSAGGSAQGVNPLLEEAELDAMNIFNNNCAETASGSRIWNCTIQSGTDDLVKRHPNVGISDVDPLLFRGRNTPAGFDPATPEAVAELDVRAVAALLFGVPVTDGLYNALQTVQINEGELPANCTVGDYTEMCMPNLTKHQVASLISGQIKTWDEFRIDDGSAGGVPFTSYPGVVPPTDKKVHFCKRVDGSGTGSQQNVKFLHHPCTEGSLEPMELDNTVEGPRLIENSGSGDMDLCLDDLSTGQNRSGKNSGLATAWATGQQSLEKNANQAFAYKFVKIDGVAPTLENAANGKYMDWVEPTYQWRKSGAGAPAGDSLRIIEKMVVDAGAPEAIATILNGESGNHPFGKSGYLAVASNGHAWSHKFDADLPVIGYSHTGTGVLNNCNVPVLLPGNESKPLVSLGEAQNGVKKYEAVGSIENGLFVLNIPCVKWGDSDLDVIMRTPNPADIFNWRVTNAAAGCK